MKKKDLIFHDFIQRMIFEGSEDSRCEKNGVMPERIRWIIIKSLV